MWSLLRGCERYEPRCYYHILMIFNPFLRYGVVVLLKNHGFLEQRDPATAPTVGDRVPYVIIKAAKGAKVKKSASCAAVLSVIKW
jgi:hypothetical protein